MFNKLKRLFGNSEQPTNENIVQQSTNTSPLTEGLTNGALSPKAQSKKSRPSPPAPGNPVTAKAKKKKPRNTKNTKKKPEDSQLSPKEQATASGEPYINILSVAIDPTDINNGSFELDWNDKFIINLIKSGYKMRPDDTDADIVDRWFTQVCRNVVMEVYEQQQADPDTRNQMRVIQRRDIGDGRAEIS